MKNLFTFSRGLETLALLFSFTALLAVLQTFLIGKHYIIPTLILLNAIILGNFTWYAMKGRTWAKIILFWFFALLTCHVFFALFWAVKPRQFLGESFIYIYSAMFLLFSVLSWQYAKQNALFSR